MRILRYLAVLVVVGLLVGHTAGEYLSDSAREADKTRKIQRLEIQIQRLQRDVELLNDALRRAEDQ